MELIQRIAEGLESRPFRVIEPGERAHSAVAVILIPADNGPDVLFIERAENEQDFWSGHVGFPGGRCEESDNSARHTAERETMEELGLDLSSAGYLGRLGDIAPGGLSMVVSCFVYLLDELPLLHLDQSEIARVFRFPLREIGNPARRSRMEIIFRQRVKKFPAICLGNGAGPLLWGISYRVIRNLCKVCDQRSGRIPSEPKLLSTGNGL